MPGHRLWTKKIIFAALTLFVVWFALELILWAGQIYFRHRGLAYAPQADLADFEEYLASRDPLLGWPARPYNPAERDASGARLSPAFPDPDQSPARVSLYGDSFVYSAEVEPSQAWGNLLAQKLGRRVANFGVGGYGTDQAFLRYRENSRDRAPDVVLGFLSENIVRNVNQFRNLLAPGARYGLKPRYVLDGRDRLRLVPLPIFSRDEYAALVADPAAALPWEYFRAWTFPRLWTLLTCGQRIPPPINMFGRPWYTDFFQADHPSSALDLTRRIMEEFQRTAQSRGQRPLILFLPTRTDLEYFRARGTWTAQPLMDLLTRDGIEFLNAAPGLLARFKDRDPAELYWISHFSPEAEAALAEIVLTYLMDREGRNGPDRGINQPTRSSNEEPHAPAP